MKAYRALLARALLRTQVGDAIVADSVYYSVRNPLHSVIHDSTSGLYLGRLERGACVAAEDVDAPEPPGLTGDRIRFVCAERPGKSRVYQRSRVHKGSEGLLNGDVECRIMRAYGNVPAKDT